MAPSNTQNNTNEELLTSSAATTNQSQSVVEGSSSSSGSQALPSLANIFDLSTPVPTLTALQRRKHDQHCSTNVLPKDEISSAASASSVKPVMQFKFATEISNGSTSKEAISKAVATQEADTSTSANTSNSSTKIEPSTAEKILLNEPDEPLGLSLELVEKCMIYALTLLSENDRLEPTEALVAVIRSVGALVEVREDGEEGSEEDGNENKDGKNIDDKKNQTDNQNLNYSANVHLLPEFEESPSAIAEAAQKIIFDRDSDEHTSGGKRWRREEEGKQEAPGQKVADLDGADGAVHELLCSLRESLASTSIGLRRIGAGAKPTPADIAKALKYAVTQTEGSAETELSKKPPLLICALRDYVAVSGVRETEEKFEGEEEVEVGAHLVLVMGASEGISSSSGGGVVGKLGATSSRTSFVVFDPFDIRAEVWNCDELAKMDIDSVWEIAMG